MSKRTIKSLIKIIFFTVLFTIGISTLIFLISTIKNVNAQIPAMSCELNNESDKEEYPWKVQFNRGDAGFQFRRCVGGTANNVNCPTDLHYAQGSCWMTDRGYGNRFGKIADFRVSESLDCSYTPTVYGWVKYGDGSQSETLGPFTCPQLPTAATPTPAPIWLVNAVCTENTGGTDYPYKLTYSYTGDRTISGYQYVRCSAAPIPNDTSCTGPTDPNKSGNCWYSGTVAYVPSMANLTCDSNPQVTVWGKDNNNNSSSPNEISCPKALCLQFTDWKKSSFDSADLVVFETWRKQHYDVENGPTCQ